MTQPKLFKPRNHLEFTTEGVDSDLSTSHSIQFKTKKQTFRFLNKVLDVGDYIFVSDGFVPLWTKVTEGVVVSKTPGTIGLRERVLTEKKIEGAESLNGQISTEVWVPRDLELLTQRGFRVDKDWIWTNQPGVVQRCGLVVGPSSTTSRKAVYHPREILTKDPVSGFLNHLLPGDYVTLWSEETPDGFLHYPVQGWVTSVDKDNGEFSYIHPPRMDIKTWEFAAHPNCQHTMGFYRKLVLQCANPEQEERKSLETKTDEEV